MVSASMTVQHTKWLQEAIELPWREPVSSLNILLTFTCWRNDHNGFSHQGPGLIDVMLSKRGTRSCTSQRRTVSSNQLPRRGGRAGTGWPLPAQGGVAGP